MTATTISPPVVRFGDTWTVGEHIFVCGDLEAGAGERVLDLAGHIEAVYTDPPWGKGEARRFRTLSGVDGGQAAPVDWRALSRRMFGLWRTCTGDVWVAMTPLEPHLSEFALEAREAGFSERERWSAFFQKRPCVLLRYRYGDGPVALAYHRNLEGIEVSRNGAAVMNGLPQGSTVADWCFGLGATPYACVLGGWRFVGSELSPDRTSQTLARVAKLTGEAPRLTARS